MAVKGRERSILAEEQFQRKRYIFFDLRCQLSTRLRFHDKQYGAPFVSKIKTLSMRSSPIGPCSKSIDGCSKLIDRCSKSMFRFLKRMAHHKTEAAEVRCDLTDRHTDTHGNYRNPRCSCAPRVKYTHSYCHHSSVRIQHNFKYGNRLLLDLSPICTQYLLRSLTL